MHLQSRTPPVTLAASQRRRLRHRLRRHPPHPRVRLLLLRYPLTLRGRCRLRRAHLIRVLGVPGRWGDGRVEGLSCEVVGACLAGGGGAF